MTSRTGEKGRRRSIACAYRMRMRHTIMPPMVLLVADTCRHALHGYFMAEVVAPCAHRSRSNASVNLAGLLGGRSAIPARAYQPWRCSEVANSHRLSISLRRGQVCPQMITADVC